MPSPKLKNPKLDPYLSPENLQWIADALLVVAEMPEEDAATAITELRTVWRRDAMGQASLLIKASNPAAYQKILKVVLGLPK